MTSRDSRWTRRVIGAHAVQNGPASHHAAANTTRTTATPDPLRGDHRNDHRPRRRARTRTATVAVAGSHCPTMGNHTESMPNATRAVDNVTAVRGDGFLAHHDPRNVRPASALGAAGASRASTVAA